jgi:hypothetical protein
MKTKRLKLFLLSVFILVLFLPLKVLAEIPVGTLLYRTSPGGKIYGKDNFYDLSIIPWQIYPGHVGMYLGYVRVDRKDFQFIGEAVIEASEGRVQLITPENFVETSKGEKFLGAKLPKDYDKMSRLQIKRLIDIALNQIGETYDWTFKAQKGPSTEQWTCVGLVEKIYESYKEASMDKPLIYKPEDYGINITPDGFDDISIINQKGDTFSKTKEFSKIHKLNLADVQELAQVSELKELAQKILNLGAVGISSLGIFVRNHNRERYFFFPYTQFLQPTLKDVSVDVSKFETAYRHNLYALSPTEQRKQAISAFAVRIAEELGKYLVKKAILSVEPLRQVGFLTEIVRKIARGLDRLVRTSIGETGFSFEKLIFEDEVINSTLEKIGQETQQSQEFYDLYGKDALKQIPSLPAPGQGEDELDVLIREIEKRDERIKRLFGQVPVEPTKPSEVAEKPVEELGEVPQDKQLVDNQQLLTELSKDQTQVGEPSWGSGGSVGSPIGSNGNESEEDSKQIRDSIPPETTLVTADLKQITSSSTITFQFFSNEDNSSFECKLDSLSWGTCSSPKVYTDLSEGNHQFQVRAIDLAGNTDQTPASFFWRIDLSKPVINLISKPHSLTNQTSALFQFAANENVSFFCQIDKSDWQNCSSPQEYANLEEGGHAFYLLAKDEAGLETLISYTWFIDLTSPISFISTSGFFNNDSWPGKISGSVSGLENDLEKVEILVQRGLGTDYLGYVSSTLAWLPEPQWLTTDFNQKTGEWSFDLPLSLLTANESYSVSSRATDLATNSGPISTASFVFDNQPPNKPENLKIFRDETSLKMNLSWDEVADFSGVDFYEINWQVDGQENYVSSTQNYFELTGEHLKTYLFKIRAIDRAGNFGPWSEAVKHQVNLIRSGWLNGWNFRQPIIIKRNQDLNSNRAIVKIEMNYQNGMQENFSDLRFTDQDGVSLFNYHLGEREDGQFGRFFVKVPFSEGSSEKLIYSYWGNPSATNESNPYLTFDWYDDFTTKTNNKYEIISGDFEWDTPLGLLRSKSSNGNEPAIISLKDFTAKDFILEGRMASGYWEGASILKYRFQNDDNFWQLVIVNNEGQNKLGQIYLEKIIDGRGIKVKLVSDLDITPREQIDYQIKVFNQKHQIYFQGSKIKGSFEVEDSDLNQAGKIILAGPGGPDKFIVDHLVVRSFFDGQVDFNSAEFWQELVNEEIPDPDGWLGGWSYRKLLVIDNRENRNNLNSYQIKFVFQKEDEMKDNLGDIRFTDSDGLSILPYWFEGVDGNQVTVWIKVPEIPRRSLKAIYLYWGNPSAESLSSAKETLDWYDDFWVDSLSDYESLAGSWRVEDGFLENAGEDGEVLIGPKDFSMKNLVLETKIMSFCWGCYRRINYRQENNNLDYYSAIAKNNDGSVHPSLLILSRIINNGGFTEKYSFVEVPITGEFVEMELKVYQAEQEAYFKGSSFEKTLSTENYYLTEPGKIFIGGHAGWVPGWIKIDYLIIRKYTKPEPTTYFKE